MVCSPTECRCNYGPTAALAIGDARPFRRTKHTGIVATELGADTIKPLSDAVEAPAAASFSAAAAPGYLMVPLLDELVVMDNVELDRNSAYGWSPMPKVVAKVAIAHRCGWSCRTKGRSVVLAGFPSAAENGLKTSRREKGPGGAPGSELFQTTCALMASGSRTVLLDPLANRRTDEPGPGARNSSKNFPNSSAADAWQRSIAGPRVAARFRPRNRGSRN